MYTFSVTECKKIYLWVYAWIIAGVNPFFLSIIFDCSLLSYAVDLVKK